MSENLDLPQPDPALRRPDGLVGRWSMEGNLVMEGSVWEPLFTDLRHDHRYALAAHRFRS